MLNGNVDGSIFSGRLSTLWRNGAAAAPDDAVFFRLVVMDPNISRSAPAMPDTADHLQGGGGDCRRRPRTFSGASLVERLPRTRRIAEDHHREARNPSSQHEDDQHLY